MCSCLLPILSLSMNSIFIIWMAQKNVTTTEEKQLNPFFAVSYSKLIQSHIVSDLIIDAGWLYKCDVSGFAKHGSVNEL